MYVCKRFCIYLWHDEPWLFSVEIYMLKILLYILGILFLLTACTSEQIRFINKSFGYFKVMRVIPIDLSNTEKHVFHIKEHDSRRTVNINLCFDFISNAGNLKVVEGLKIKARISMGRFSHEIMTDSAVWAENGACWFYNDSHGLQLLNSDLPADIDFDNPLTIEFQIMESDCVKWTFYSNPHDLDEWGRLPPPVKINVVKGDTVALRKIANPRLVVVTGNYSVGEK